MLSLLRSSPPLAAAGTSITRCSRRFSHSPSSFWDMSKITISGKLFKSPELSKTSSGRQCIRYTIRSWKGKERTNFFNIMCITDNAQSIKFLTELPRGTKVVAEGEFSPYQLAQQDGSKISKYSIFSSPHNLYVIEMGEPEVAGEDAQAQPAPAPTEGDGTPEHQAPAEGDGTPEHQAPAEGDGTPEHQASTEGDGTPEYQASTEGDGTPEYQASTEGDGTSEYQASTEGDGTPEHQASTEGDGTPENQAPPKGDGTPERQAPN